MAIINSTILKSKPLKNGGFTVYITVAHKSVTRVITTGIEIDGEYQLKNNKIIKHPNAELLSLKLRTIIDRYEKELLDIDQSVYSCNEIVSYLKHKKKAVKGNTITSILESYIETLEREKSKRAYTMAVRRFIKHMGNDVVIGAISPHDIQSFHNQLMSDKVSPTTINIYMTQIKIILDYAKKLKMVKYKVDPFEVYKKPQSSVRDLDISVGELKRIRDLETDIYALKVTRDIFMLSYYLAGMNITDILDYNFKGKKQVQYIRKKTEHTKSGNNQTCFTIQPEAKEIISRYMLPNGKLQFGKYDTRSKVDNLLHRNMTILGSEVNIAKRISYYTARKSFVQHGFELGIPLETIEYCIGQSMKRNRPIFNYVKIMSKHADIAIRQILDNIK